MIAVSRYSVAAVCDRGPLTRHCGRSSQFNVRPFIPWVYTLKFLADEPEQRRNASSAGDYDENILMTKFTPISANLLSLRTALKDKPDEATRFWKAQTGMIDPAEFFEPGRLRRLLRGAGSSRG
jgi:hypothetical protein